MRVTLNILFASILLTIFLLSCGESAKDISRKKYLDGSIVVDEKNVPIDSMQNYYPYELFKDTNQYPGSDHFLVDWFSKHLFAMKEPLLFNKASNTESYRFLWLRTFDDPVSIRIEKDGNDIHLYWRKCDGAGGYEPGKLIIKNDKKLTLEQWKNFTSHIDTLNFWGQTVNDFDRGLDGSEWIIEGASPNRYHVIYRWTPMLKRYKGTNKEIFYKACRYLIDLTDLKIQEDLIY